MEISNAFSAWKVELTCIEIKIELRIVVVAAAFSMIKMMSTDDRHIFAFTAMQIKENCHLIRLPYYTAGLYAAGLGWMTQTQAAVKIALQVCT